MNYVQFEEKGIRASFDIYSVKEEGDKRSCYIPAFKIAYTSPDNVEEAGKRGSAMVKAFFNHWLLEEPWKKFIFDLHNKGFRAKQGHAMVMKELLNSRRIKGKLLVEPPVGEGEKVNAEVAVES